ncbi:mechanosensitive ion channel family protein [Natrononativus amylolyticus]|uniref:mechanosensitive ion channel family protein n=1 Tax=Natrononativus amylolyticus TaxID=2963434 RepID=UPI0020CDF625|nr:mechanosensitive ion channel family protein [Natrononativus amylolyticus]
MHPGHSSGGAITAVGDAVSETLATSWFLAVLVALAVWYGSGLAADRVRPTLEERLLRRTTAKAVLLVGRVVLVLYALVPVAGVFGFQPRNVLLSVTVLSVIAGAILAPAARSYVSGLFVLLNRPYDIGDMIEFVEQDERGYVEDVTLRYTKVFTLDNAFLVVPNETMRERDIRNLSAEDERVRASVEVLVTYESDLETARQLLERSARDVEGVITGGPDIRVGQSRFTAQPRAFIREFADHGVLLDLRFWVERPYLPLRVRSDVQERAWERLAEVDVEIAYPHTHHVFDETSGRVRVGLEDAGSASVDGALERVREERTAD